MSAKTIEITISPTGQSNIQTHGFSGNDCRAASRFLETALGRATSETLTSEFHQTVSGGACPHVFHETRDGKHRR